MNGISLLLPTKSRHNRLETVVKSIQETVIDKKNIELCFLRIKGDVDTKNEIDRLIISYPEITIKVIESGPIPFNRLWNVAYTISTKDIVMLCGDDMRFVSKDWDKSFIEEFSKFPDGVALIWARDSIQAGRLPVHPAVTRKWVDALGYFTPERFAYWYADNWLDELSKEVSFKLGDKHGTNIFRRKIYLKDVFIEHLHWSNGSCEKDSVYKENEEKLNKEEHAKWACAENHRLIMSDVEKLMKLINEHNTSNSSI